MYPAYYDNRLQPKPSCFSQCIHFDIDDYLIAEARRLEELIEKQHKNDPTARNIHAERHFVGALCQIGVGIWAQAVASWVEVSDYFNPHNNKDDGWDIKHRTLDDVKGRSMNPKYPVITGYTPFWVNIDQYEKKAGKVDYFVFADANLDEGILHIAGCISYSDLKRAAEEVDGDYPRYQIRARDLKNYRGHIFSV